MKRTIQDQSNKQMWTERALAAAAALFLAFFMGRYLTIYYDLNDDSLMAEILAGSFTGTPASHNIQSYYPLTVLLAFLYRLNWSIDWYSGFLLLLQYGGAVLVVWRILRDCRDRKKRYATVLLAVLAAAGLLQEHYVYLQYSVTVGILGAAAVFLFLTMNPQRHQENGMGVQRAWLRELMPPIGIILAGFLLRSEMMLFVGPFAALAFLIRTKELCFGEQGEGTERNQAAAPRRMREFLQVCGLTFVLTVGGMGICWLGNQAGCSREWKEFYQLFDARTQLYDFQKLPTYEENQEFYDSIGLDSAQVQLILNYNYGLDQNIDAKTLQTIADYAAEKAAAQKSTGQRLKDALWDYREAMLGRGEHAGEPYPVIAAVLYLSALGSSLGSGRIPVSGGAGTLAQNRSSRGRVLAGVRVKAGEILLTAVVFALRSALFLYLYYHNRPVVRLTHSLYLCEAVFLLWILWRNVSDKGRAAFLCCAAAVLALGYGSVWQTAQIRTQQSIRIQNNAPYLELQEYARNHSDNIYLLDVYSTVSFSDAVGTAAAVPVNLDLLGGWASKSPLERDKLCALGVEQDAIQCEGGTYVAQILQMEENVYVAAEASADVEWLSDYYSYLGEEVTVSETDRIGENWIIYAVNSN